MKKTLLLLLTLIFLAGCGAETVQERKAAIHPDNKIYKGGNFNHNCNLSDSLLWDTTTSSSLKPSGIIKYDASGLWDISVRSAWVEAAQGWGIGEWIEIDILKALDEGAPDQEYDISGITMFTGYCKNEKAWKSNGRVKKLGFYFNGKKMYSFLFQDTMARQFISIPTMPLKSGDKIKLIIEEVYEGSGKDTDTAISEIVLDGACH